ncbi:hypothetical protein B0H14DRAFT_2677986 [Mycena olivaceomarginata]|nr:hypothetical protein B0H14DRAFT_2677986 [Mycena olivaceomarginata]
MDSRANAQREQTRRGFSIYVSHQKVVLEIDFSGCLWGYTEITIVPTSKDLKTIHLHSRQCTIQTVTVASLPAEFTHNDPLANLTVGAPNDPLDCHRHPELKRKLYSALQESDEGELSIAIPLEVALKHSGQSVEPLATPEPQTPGAQASQAVPEFAPIAINIAYSLRNPADGFQFVFPTDSYPYRVPHAYTTPSSPDAARCWVPCIDNLWEKCTWEFEFVVPRYLEEISVEDDEPTDASPTLVVCSGELVEQVAHPYSSHKTIFLFSQAVLTSVQHIAFAAGPFHMYSIPLDHIADDGNSSQPPMYAFCLPGHESLLTTSTACLRSAMSFYTTEFGSYPFGSYKLAFLLTVDLLHAEDAIEQSLETRHALSHALACQWMGINIQPKFFSDTWLKDMQRVVERDTGTMPPICQPTRLEPPDAAEISHINLKAPLLGKSGTSLGLSRVLPKIFLSALTGENNTISTHMFLRTCRKVSGVDPRTFAEQWIYGSGCPTFGFSASFNRKKMAVEITMRQECPAYKMLEGNEHALALLKPVRIFEGQMTVRIHEADGTPYEHVLDIQAPFKRYEVPFNTKYKRVRRNTKRYLARQAAAQAAAEGDTEAAEAMGMVDMGFGLEVWEKESERNNWKWIADLKFEQQDFMWVSQLQRDRDVVAQLEALHALAQQPTKIVSSTLTKTVLVSNYYFRIRCEAAVALVHCSIPRLDYLGLFHLFKLFLRYCYDPEDPNQDLFAHTYVPKPNDFSDLSEYFVRKVSSPLVRRTLFPELATRTANLRLLFRKFLIDQLRYNDNTSNAYADGFYICTIISSAAYATISTASPERGELLPSEVRTEYNEEDADLLKQSLSEVDRYRAMDRLIPSTHNNVTIACLEVAPSCFFILSLWFANLIPSAPIQFFPLTREGNYTQVRIAAFDGLFMTKWYTPPIMNYVLAVMAHDPSRIVRRFVARCACLSLALLVQMGEMKLNSKDPESLLIEEDGSIPDKNKESRKSEMDAMIKALRKDKEVGKNEVFRELMMPLALAPDVDHEVRWCLLKLADLLIKPIEETAPTVKIHIPITPATETPPVLTPLPSKPRPLKLAGPAQSPVIPNHVAPKLKIPCGRPSGVRTPVRTPSVEPQAQARAKSVAFAVPALPPKAKPVPVPKAKPPPPPSKPNGVPAKPVHALKAQASGMSKLQGHKHAKIFLHPVDPIRDHAPNYFDVIREPMDLQSMAHKLEGGKYADRFAFQADFRLMMANAKLYNPVGSFAHDETLALETYFEKQWTIINKTLEAAHAKEATTQKPPPKPPVPRAFPNPPAPQPTPSTLKRLNPKRQRQQRQHLNRPSSRNGNRRSNSLQPSFLRIRPRLPMSTMGRTTFSKEVLALEREKASVTNGKRKKVDISEGEDEAEDDLLALATPAKKGRPSPTEPSSSAVPKIVLNTHKSKPPADPPESRPLPVDVPRISAKGKEKEVTTTGGPPARSKKSQVAQATPIDEKRCKQLLSTLMKLPESGIFLRPVDPVLDGCPTYFDEIERPMDFGTISANLASHGYETMEQLRKDVDLVFSNCKTFNPPATFPWDCADVVEKVFKKEWPKLMERKLSPNEKRGLQGILTTLGKEEISWVFREPVDPVLLQIPTYFDIVKHPRDLHTIRNWLNGDKYETVEAFEADIQLMVDNAITFNGLQSDVGALAIGLRDRFRELLRNWKAGANKKRKDGEKANSQPMKKIKIG